MGALSSWAMLALTHHFIIQVAAIRAGYRMGAFDLYAVLGDDVVIANKKVARQYLTLLDQLGVSVGLAKSLVSPRGTLEFAKRYMNAQNDLSPVPFKEVAASLQMFNGMTALVNKYSLKLTTVARLYGYGFRTVGRLDYSLDKLPNRLRSLVV
jgi:hypothetical protein